MQTFAPKKFYAALPLETRSVDGVTLPYSLRVLLEGLHRKGVADVAELAREYAKSLKDPSAWVKKDIPFYPSRVLMQDFTGVPAIVDLAAMRDEVAEQGGNASKVNPLIPVDLVIDHSIMVDYAGTSEALKQNTELDYQRNLERYAFLHWGQQAFQHFRVVPPGQGICHQVNLEQLASVVMKSPIDGGDLYFPDVVVGTDSHTTMVNGLGVLGWGVGGIEAEAAMLGKPLSLLMPSIIGVHVYGRLREGVTATDVVLTLTSLLRKKGVVGCFVEFYGDGLNALSLADRATLANMAPEYGATCGFFPVDEETINYLTLTGRNPDHIADVRAYCEAQGLWRTDTPHFHDTVELDLNSIVPTLAGPKRPQDQLPLTDVVSSSLSICEPLKSPPTVYNAPLNHHHVVIAAITSCTNTSNPALMIAAGLVARKAKAAGLKIPGWVKTSFAPGSQVVKSYLEASGLLADLEDLGFNIVGYGCTTCIGNSGPLDPEITKAIEENQLNVAGVLSGNRNFEGRIHANVKLNYLASPPLVVAYALAGTMLCDMEMQSIQNDVKLADIWPTSAEIQAILHASVNKDVFVSTYKKVSKDPNWHSLADDTRDKLLYTWPEDSTYIRKPPFAKSHKISSLDVKDARILAVLGDSITTDHISPAGSIKLDSPAGKYLTDRGVQQADFNSYGARRGNHEVMMRGTFANIRLKNAMVDRSGGWTKYQGSEMPIYDAAMKYQTDGTPLIIIAGKEYGTGSSRDWAAKGTMLLGVKAVIAESFERIHRSNLVGMGVMPLEWMDTPLTFTGEEVCHIEEMCQKPGEMTASLVVQGGILDGKRATLRVRIDTYDEWEAFRRGGLLPTVVRDMCAA